ncbi:hypothetical protein GGU11DRAFT_723328 [Lentinula aff. detonsa]|nr:hypothetical protein GGU11DRAFT_723328 [Lentinula aff. detonsa]
MDTNEEFATLNFIINHVFFPPKLPQKSDVSTSRNFALCSIFLELAEEYGRHLDTPSQKAWRAVLKMLRCYQESQESQDINVETLQKDLQHLDPGGFLILYIQKQNAALFIRRLFSGDVSISSFEVSFPNAEVMAAEARIACTFPGPAITIPSPIWRDTSFRHEFSNFLLHMNRDGLDDAEAHTKKANSTVVEMRDVADPKYISELLMGIFHGIGSPTAIEDVRFVKKRIGDDVLWKNAFLPWRRSPVYLVLRVGLQLALSYVYSSVDADHYQYKAFMGFAQASFLQRAVQDHPDLETDLLYAMRTKVARRIHKLEIRFPTITIPPYVMTAAQEASNAVEEVLQNRWDRVQSMQDQSPEWNPESLNFEDDTLLPLENARPRILQALQRSASSISSSTFAPQDPHRLRYETDFSTFTRAKLESIFADNTRVALADFEYVVHTHLGSWTETNLVNSNASRVIYECMEVYFSESRRIYSKKNPEDQSLIILALSAMWVSLDKIAVAQVPLLAQYSPEITTKILEPLLLWQTNDLGALQDIVHYISDRCNRAQILDGIFTDSESESTFYQRYFDSSPSLQSLKKQIEDDATKRRQECRRLLEERNSRYYDLMRQASTLSHDHKTVSRQKKKRWMMYEDKSGCQRCRLEAKAKGIPHIDVDEWPLPSRVRAANRVCFELACPEPFERWRAATWLLLYNSGTQSRYHIGKSQQYGKLPGTYAIPVHSTPIKFTLATATKSFKVSHYRSRPIPAKEEDVMVNCGSTWKLFSILDECWAADRPFSNSSFKEICTPVVMDPYQALQFSLEGTSHTSNAVISAQAHCHPDLSLHEFVAFGSLRSGGRLQWMNIAREIVAGSLTFRCESVHTLLLQAAFQVGNWKNSKNEGWALEWHHELTDENFARKLLEIFMDLMDSVASNWDAVVSLRGIILLTCRIMSGNPTIEDLACQLLRCARKIGMEWIAQLQENLSSASEDHHTILSTRLCEIAATCRATYSGDPANLKKLLQTSDDSSTFIYCAAIIYENTPSKRGGLSREFCRFLDRDERLAVSVYDHLIDLVTEDCTGLDKAVALLWPAYRPYKGWKRLCLPNECWVETKTAPSSSQAISQQVHINMIDGRLLIEGKLVGRLPREITDHALYTRCLQQKILEVVPSDIPGMEYSSRHLVSGYEIHFCYDTAHSDLVIRTRQQAEISELIPHMNFSNDLPNPFWKDYVHWLRISKEVIELCPLQDIWSSLPSNKHITDIVTFPRMLVQGQDYLIAPHSQTARMIAAQLAPLEYPDEILIMFSRLDGTIMVNLPRFRSDFLLKDQVLQSKNMPGFCVDHSSHRSMGAMFGLQNQLVLRPADSGSNEMKKVLVPYGQVQVQKDHMLDHVTVKIEYHSEKQATYHEYLVNTDLGCLEANTSLTPHLYKVYLHAVTSGRLPDPLTGRTGTEEALLEYSSASCMSFLELAEADRDLLELIKALQPKRTFYPEHLKVMQNVLWHPELPPLSQHCAFSCITNNIWAYAQKLSLFRSNTISDFGCLSDQSSPLLVKKAEFREALFHNPDLQAISSSSSQDSLHTLRSITPANLVSKTSQQIFLSFNHDEGLLAVDTSFSNLYSLFKEWSPISPALRLEVNLSYSQDWLAPSFGDMWLSVFDLLRKQGTNACYPALFTLSAMAFHSPGCMHIIPAFLSFGIDPQFQIPSFPLPELSPQCSVYRLERGLKPDVDHIKCIVSEAAYGLDSAPWEASNLHQGKDEDDWSFFNRKRKDYERQQSQLATKITQHYISLWPAKTTHLPINPAYSLLFDMTRLHSDLTDIFANCFQNLKLHEFLVDLQSALQTIHCRTYPYPMLREIPFPPARSAPSSMYFKERWSLEILFNQRTPPQRDENGSVIPDTQELASLLSELRESSKPFLKLYGEQLNTSRLSFHLPIGSRADGVDEHSARYIQRINEIMNCLSSGTEAELLSKQAGQWPRLTVKTLLRHLSLELRACCPSHWRNVLTALACDLLHLQHARRVVDLRRNQSPLYVQEIEATPVPFIEACENPEWVLIQIESRFTLRPLQHLVLQEMVYPSSNTNTVYQLNMGEGKSSVIAPLAVTTLADRKTLVRLVILKPLTRQMFHLLVARLTGLCGRRIFFLPFSRSVNMGPAEIDNVRSLLQECVDVGGILITQPEHILSFRLLTIERLIANHPTGPTLMKLQKWLSKCSRDIFDESDEILHSKYQLIYTMGQQQPLEDHPDRWITIQHVFSLVSQHLNRLKHEFPTDIEVLEKEPGSFPSFRLLKPAPGTALREWLADDIMAGRLENVNFSFLASEERKVVRKFITIFDVDTENVNIVQRYFEAGAKWGSVLLLRGLLGQGLLEYVLMKRRWRVDYGLDLKRSLLAVPYRAKDVPSLNAEFGHPDITLLLTCLSYYYQGLDKDQFLTALQLLLNSDNAAAEYETWIIGLDLPPELRQETGINLEDPTQLTEILLPRFRQTKRVIDFYLTAIVFPKAAKEFPNKLSTSAWDLAEKSQRVKTGFSGTNDNQFLLPTTIRQESLPGQEGTSAKVLSYLLQPENGPCISPDNLQLDYVPLKALLSHIASLLTPVRILFDVGAQVMEVNQEVAMIWLETDSKAQAAIYFDDKDEVTVLTRDGTIEPFILSSFRNRLGECVIYLDDAHTRGTDLKFPSQARALVTLGETVTKDRLVQGKSCMRLRQLGQGQSVLFFAPLEIARAIRTDARRVDSDVIQVIDILRWAMLRTCEDIEHHISHWVQQGVDFHGRNLVWTAAQDSDSPHDIAQLSSAWLRPEARTLEQLYLPLSAQTSSSDHIVSSNVAKAREIPEIQARLDMLGILNIGDAGIDEEQEREVAQEIEQERQQERPPPAEPLSHHVLDDVRALVKTGKLNSKSSAFLPLFNTVPLGTWNQLHEKASRWSNQLWATRDFSTTTTATGSSKEHMRPVNWLLSVCPASSSAMNIVVLSPYEVQELLPAIRESKVVNLHMYSPRIRREMRTFEDLKFFCIPPLHSSWSSPDSLIISQLNLFSGQLYFSNYDVYRNLCAFLGLGAHFEGSAGPVVDSDGFVRPAARFDDKVIEIFYTGCPFVFSPVLFLRELTALRRKGNKYSSTHMGKILHGRFLVKEDFD